MRWAMASGHYHAVDAWVARMQPPGRREAPPDDRLREIRGHLQRLLSRISLALHPALMALEILHLALVLFRSRARFEGAEIAALTGLRIDLSGIEPVLARLQFADHGTSLLLRVLLASIAMAALLFQPSFRDAPSWRGPGIHTPDGSYGFRVRSFHSRPQRQAPRACAGNDGCRM